MSQVPDPPSTKRPPKMPFGPRKNLETPPAGPNWSMVWWYLPLMLLLLWVWQDQLHEMSVKSIPYSEFEQDLARGEVTECQVQETEITGKIMPKPAEGEPPAHQALAVPALAGLRRNRLKAGLQRRLKLGLRAPCPNLRKTARQNPRPVHSCFAPCALSRMRNSSRSLKRPRSSSAACGRACFLSFSMHG